MGSCPLPQSGSPLRLRALDLLNCGLQHRPVLPLNGALLEALLFRYHERIVIGLALHDELLLLPGTEPVCLSIFAELCLPILKGLRNAMRLLAQDLVDRVWIDAEPSAKAPGDALVGGVLHGQPYALVVFSTHGLVVCDVAKVLGSRVLLLRHTVRQVRSILQGCSSARNAFEGPVEELVGSVLHHGPTVDCDENSFVDPLIVGAQLEALPWEESNDVLVTGIDGLLDDSNEVGPATAPVEDVQSHVAERGASVGRRQRHLIDFIGQAREVVSDPGRFLLVRILLHGGELLQEDVRHRCEALNLAGLP
mmetsp:Transcript_72704/g.157782  ORF Transcript_72704/g.157782 Transcript_72704/m.157782 type:complete len:308 (-) Transcript_72704:214-1137(-)